MKKVFIYIHGKGGDAKEAEHFVPLFPGYAVVGFDYRAQTPWEARDEFRRLYDTLCAGYDGAVLSANSIGAYFAMNALSERKIERAFFISPIVDMEKLIVDMMRGAGITESELKEKGDVNTKSGERLSWDYLSRVREYQCVWNVPTEILYGENDKLQSYETVKAFADRTGAGLTVMKGGEHWFHTKEQRDFMDSWIKGHLSPEK